ncbi:hypothetical protein Tco_0539276 [Tanacetum coccineum]
MTNIDELLLKLLGHLGLSNTLDAHTGNNNANAIQHSPMSHASSNASPTASRIASPPAYYTSVGPRYYPTIAPQVSPLTYNAPPPGFGYLPATQTGTLHDITTGAWRMEHGYRNFVLNFRDLKKIGGEIFNAEMKYGAHDVQVRRT